MTDSLIEKLHEAALSNPDPRYLYVPIEEVERIIRQHFAPMTPLEGQSAEYKRGWYEAVAVIMGVTGVSKEESTFGGKSLPATEFNSQAPANMGDASARKDEDNQTGVALTSPATDSAIIGMTCCENGRFGDGHECLKQPGEPSEISGTEVLEGAYDAAYEESERLRHRLRLEITLHGHTKSKLKIVEDAYEALQKMSAPVAAGEIQDNKSPYAMLSTLLHALEARGVVLTDAEDSEWEDAEMKYQDDFNRNFTATKPVSVSLEKCAEEVIRADDEAQVWPNSEFTTEAVARHIAKAVLDAAGVKYVD